MGRGDRDWYISRVVVATIISWVLLLGTVSCCLSMEPVTFLVVEILRLFLHAKKLPPVFTFFLGVSQSSHSGWDMFTSAPRWSLITVQTG